VTRLLHLFALVAMALASVTMHGAPASAAAPHHRAAQAGHCGDSEQSGQDRDRSRSADCALACAALPCATAAAMPAPLPRLLFTRAPEPFFAGTAPGSDPPPPRLS
jgi:hypothetical protein